MKIADISHRSVRLASSVALLATLSAALLAACGGGEEDTVAPLAQAMGSKAGTSNASVMLEGCVVDELFIPRTGSRVRVLSADGRLLGQTTSDGDGLFTIRVPAGQTVSVAIDRPDGEGLEVPTGHTGLSVGACLHDPRA